jgi:cytochrome c2
MLAGSLDAASLVEDARVGDFRRRHSWPRGVPLEASPRLFDCIGRAMATAADFEYSSRSAAARAKLPPYGLLRLDGYPRFPEDLAPGTAMTFDGLPDPAVVAAAHDGGPEE